MPETERLFQSSPSIRRNLIDQFIYTSQNKYNKLVNRYTKLIQERSKILINNNNDESWLNQLEKSISADALQIYSLRESQLKILINNLNIYLRDFDFLFKIDTVLIDKFYTSNLKCEDYEVALKKHISDKTNWREMLKGNSSHEDLLAWRHQLEPYLPEEVKPYFLANNQPLNLLFPVEQYHEKPKSLNLTKIPEYEGILVGIKGQYLIFEDETVFNIRSNEGLVIGLDVYH